MVTGILAMKGSASSSVYEAYIKFALIIKAYNQKFNEWEVDEEGDVEKEDDGEGKLKIDMSKITELKEKPGVVIFLLHIGVT